MKTDLDYLKDALEGVNPDARTWVVDTLEAIVGAAIELKEIERIREIGKAKEIERAIDEEIEKVKEEKKSRFSKT